MLKSGMQSSLSDAAVGMLCARTAVTGAYFNVRINAKDLKDRKFAEEILGTAKSIYEEALGREQAVIALVDSKM